MIKLKNVEAVGFTSPSLQPLFNDGSRTFPMQDAFKIADAIEVIRMRLTPYFAEQRKIIEGNSGTIAQNGSVSYADLDAQLKAAEQIRELGEVALEYPIEKITPCENWPNLTLIEASILRPILNQNVKG